MGWAVFGLLLLLADYKFVSSSERPAPLLRHSAEAKPSCQAFITWAQCGSGMFYPLMGIQKKLLPAGNSPTPALCHCRSWGSH